MTNSPSMDTLSRAARVVPSPRVPRETPDGAGKNTMLLRGSVLGFSLLLIGAGFILLGGALILVATGLIPAEVVTGPLLIASGIQMFRRRTSALHLFAVYFLIEWISALWQTGLDGWALLPRLDFGVIVLALFLVLPAQRTAAPDRLSARWSALPAWARSGLPALAVIAPLVTLLVAQPGAASPRIADRTVVSASSDWRAFGGDVNAGKFSPLAQIDNGNVSSLGRLWEYVEPARTGGKGPEYRKDEATPLVIRDRVYVCTADDVVLALDAETGRLIWRYDPHADASGVGSAICRGVAYAESTGSATCARRILIGTIDARLIALDAEDGKPCAGFGAAGQVDLTLGLGTVKKGYYYVTSPPTVANGIAVIGALVRDNEEVGEPSGVVRGYDVATGKLRWAWDMGRPGASTRPLAQGETYTRGTPNAWTVFSADPELGMVYVPTGNATPDFVGEPRRKGWEAYSSALVALDLASGSPRWIFQTVHHDLWDNDLSSNPVLASLPTPAGTVPVVMFGTKQGQIFVLDRRNGRPVAPVRERPVPQTDVPGERTAPTQPLSAGMPDLGGPRLTDADMWGLTPFDRMFCRVKLRRVRYEGPLTPPSLRGSLVYPGLAGGIDWGGMSYDPGRHLLLVPTMHLAQTVTLIPRDGRHQEGNTPQRGTRYSTQLAQFMTRLGIPCQRPPYARMTAIDMRTRKAIWQRPMGTAETIGPLGVATRLPLMIGAPPVIGGGISTAGDLTFIGAYGDRRLRAIDSRSGKLLWSARLPEGNQATPVTYSGPRSHRQIVLMVSGNWADLQASHNVPTHVVAYALKPRR